MTKTFNLKATTQKSYYGKAKITIDDDGTITLTSYATQVARLTPTHDGTTYTLEKLWHGYSRTTQNHINDFLRLYDLPTMSKKEWLSNTTQHTRYKVKFSNGFASHYSDVIFDDYEMADDYGNNVVQQHRYNIWHDVIEIKGD